ncbi:MAG: translation initiation factor IF-2 [Sulfolobales archaeon]
MSADKRLRQPIVVVLGHVDHGKTSLLDKIRGTAVIKKEPGEMTQHIGASLVPSTVINELTKPLKSVFNIQLRIPGLLFIDTPGHEAFSNLRKRGGSIADFSILVVDINEGVKKQTIECIEILRSRKVPFIIAANKIDKTPSWKPYVNEPFLLSIKKQPPQAVEELDKKIYKLIGELSNFGFNAERFDRVKDFTKTLAIVPVSAKSGEGVPELLAVLAGLAQKYLTHQLMFAEGPASGVVLEVKEVPGLGTCIDVIIYNGILRKGNEIVVGGLNKPIVTKVRALLMPKPLDEMRAPEGTFISIDEVVAASGVRISAPGLDEAIAGAPVYVVPEGASVDEYVRRVSEEVAQVRIRKEIDGVVVKTDALGTLEAIVSSLESRGVPVRIADVGALTKREVVEASVVAKKNKYLGVILLFNVKALPDAEELALKEGIKILSDNLIYKLMESYDKWVNELRDEERRREMFKIVFPCKFKVLPGCVFRRSDPAIVGVEILEGILRSGYPVIRSDGRELGAVMQIQDKGKNIHEVRKGAMVAISIKGNVMVGRHFDENDILYTNSSEEDLKTIITKYPETVDSNVAELIKELIKIKQKSNPTFGLSIIQMLRNFEVK